MTGRGEMFGRSIDQCESPIERLFLVGLLYLAESTFDPFVRHPVIARDGNGIELGQQVPVGNYRLDFALTCCGARKFAIELDGHAYHGATPGQFTRDAGRQREITNAGWTVVRFSGQEVTRDPRACGRQAYDMALASLQEAKAVAVAEPKPMLAELSWDEEVRLMREAESRVRSGHTALHNRKVGT